MKGNAQNAKRPALGPRLFGVSLALVSFLVSSFLLHNSLPEAHVDGFSEKLSFLREHGAGIDTLFIGSSRIYRGISPQVFDEEMARLGRPTRSFNFGLDAMMLPESAYVLERVLALKLPHLRWVFLELDDLHLKPWEAHRQTQRLRYWHDWERTSSLLRKSADTAVSEKWKKHLGRAWELRAFIQLHLQEFMRQTSNVGAGLTLIEQKLSSAATPPQEKELVLGPSGDGFAPVRGTMTAKLRSSYLEAIGQHGRATTGHPVDPYAETVLQNCAARIRRYGASPIFLVPPAFPFQADRFTFAQPVPGPVLAFANTAAFPELYRVEARADADHLNSQGARVFTRLLAEEFAGEVATNPSP